MLSCFGPKPKTYVECENLWNKTIEETVKAVVKVDHPDADLDYMVERVKMNLERVMQCCGAKWGDRIDELDVLKELDQTPWFREFMETARKDITINVDGITNIFPPAYTQLPE